MLKKSIVFIFITFSVMTLASTSFAQGRKMGLFVGIDEYQDGISKLRSCVNDAIAMRGKLSRSYGFNASDTSLLTDAQATRQNILDKLSYYERMSSKGDMFVMFYSGHGSVFPDANSFVKDETQQFGMRDVFPTGYYDSTLVPVDARRSTSGKAWKNMILDDELNEIFSRFTAKGVQVIFISDSCHAGSLAKSLDLEDLDEYKFTAPKSVGFDPSLWQRSASVKGSKTSENFNKLFLVIGSSQDNQFSSAKNPETSFKMSLFTYAFLKHLDYYESNNRVLTYRNVNNVISPFVNKISKGKQTPRLDYRFFETSLLDNPIFSIEKKTNDRMSIVVKVEDENGRPITDAAFAVLPSTANTSKEGLNKSDLLIFGRTNRKGLFSSGSKTLKLGTYKVKVVKSGYKAFVQDMKVIPAKNNTLVFIFKLVKE